MIEKRTMWLLEGDLEKVNQVTAIFDTEKKQIVCYSYDEPNSDETWLNVCNRDTFYSTEAEAKEARLRKIDEAREKMKTCLSLIKELDYITPSDDFIFERNDYLGEHGCERTEYWYKRVQELTEELSLLTNPSLAKAKKYISDALQTNKLNELWKK